MRIALLGNPDNLHVIRWVRFLAGRGHELLLVADPHTRARPEGIEIAVPKWGWATEALAFRLTPKPHGNTLWKAVHYRPLIRRFRPDVVHGFEAYYNGLATAWAGPYPRVLTPWGKDVHHDADLGPIYGWAVGRALRGVDCISTNDETLPEFLAERYGIEKERVFAFSWGVDLSVFRPGLEEGARRWKERLQIEPEAPLVFSPRLFQPHWGGEAIVEAVPAILSARADARIVILAARDDGGFRSAMKRRAEALGVAGAIRWIEDWLEPEAMATLYNAADVFISIPKTDLLAMTVLEGMACGCLPILSDQPAYRKHAKNEENALVLESLSPAALGRAVTQAIADEDLSRRAAAIGPERMAREENAARNMVEIETAYERAMERRRRRRA
jgi:glycosyltransferase involved in cell wall biosynthesis